MKKIIRKAAAWTACFILTASTAYGAVSPQTVPEGAAPVSESEAVLTEGQGTVSQSEAAQPQDQSGQIYQEAEKAYLQKVLPKFKDNYEKKLHSYAEQIKGTSSTIEVVPGETGRALMGLFSPVDLSWANSAKIELDCGLNNGIAAFDLRSFINDSPIVSGTFLIDPASGYLYGRLPEFSDQWFKMLVENAGVGGSYSYSYDSDDSDDDDWDDDDYDDLYSEEQAVVSDMFAFMEQTETVLPSPDSAAALLERYLNPIVEGFSYGSSEETTLAVGDVQQACTLYEGRMYEKDALFAVKSVLEMARADEDLKQIIQSLPVQDQDLYTAFIAEIDNSLEDFSEMDPDTMDTDSYVVSRIWIDEEGDLIGREFGFMDNYDTETKEQIFLAVRNVHSSEKFASSVFFSDGSAQYGNYVLVQGEGTEDADGILNGTFNLFTQGRNYLTCTLSGYDTALAEQGYMKANLQISPGRDLVQEVSDGSFNPSQIALVLDIDINEATENILADVQLSGSSVASLKISEVTGASLPELDPDAAASAIDVNDPDASAMYQPDFSQLTANLRQAGASDAVIETLFGSAGFPEDSLEAAP